MTIDSVTLMEFESGQLDTTEIVEMLAEMIQFQGLESIEDNFLHPAKQYIAKGVLSEEGDINYIKLKEEI